jgi:hypothetical protein
MSDQWDDYDDFEDEPKKKRGRPKGSFNKASQA